MRTVLISILVLISSFAFANAREAAAADIPIVVELFTSQGCSSCPPADKLLSELDAQPIEGLQIIVLSQHVDYWNGLGWKDPFSNREFSERQRRYGASLAAGRVYTPQMVVNGQTEFVGNRRATAFETIRSVAHSPREPTEVQVSMSWLKLSVLSLNVEFGDLSHLSTECDVMLAVTESDLSSRVTSGENSGRRLAHSGVVRLLTSLGTVSSGSQAFETASSVPIKSGWDREQLHVVVFVQERDQGRILGATALPVPTRQRSSTGP